jgi:hypothetical protein
MDDWGGGWGGDWSSVTIPGLDFPSFDTSIPSMGGFDASTLPDFGSVSSFNNTFQDVINTQLPALSFAFDPSFQQVPEFAALREMVPSILAQQDQIQEISNNLVSKAPELQQQYSAYNSAYSDYQTKLNNYNNFGQYAVKLGGQYRANTRYGPAIEGPATKTGGIYHPAWYVVKSGNMDTGGYGTSTNYADVVQQSATNVKTAQDTYTNSYTAYQNEVKTLQDTVTNYKTTVSDYDTQTKTIVEEKQLQQQKEQERIALEQKQQAEADTLAQKQAEEAEKAKVAQVAKEEQDRLVAQHAKEAEELANKQAEEVRQAEETRQAEEAKKTEDARIKTEDDAKIKAEEDTRIKAEDDARLKQLEDALKVAEPINTPPTLVADLNNSSVTISQPSDTDTSIVPPSNVDTSDEVDLPPNTSTDLPDLNPSENENLTPEEQYNKLMLLPNMTTELAEQLSTFSPKPKDGPLSTLPTTQPEGPLTTLNPSTPGPTGPLTSIATPTTTPPTTTTTSPDLTADSITVNPPLDTPETETTNTETPVVKEDPTKDPTKPPTIKPPTVTVKPITTPTTTPKTTVAPASTKSAFQPAADATGGISNLTPGLTKAMNDYQLTGLNAIDTSSFDMASGGSTSGINDLNSEKDYNPLATSSMSYLKPGLTRANLQYALTGMPTPTMRKADGGEIMQEDLSMPEGHRPEFFSEGGLHNRYVRGDGDGTSDDVPAMLANGEFVIPADVVASLGNGDNDSGAKVLDEFLAVIRKHKRAADAKHLPPDSKGALGYLAEAHSKVRA